MPFAEQGFATSRYVFGAMYCNGDGVPQDSLLIRVHVRIAVTNGNGTAAGVRYMISGELSEWDQAAAEEIALHCLRRVYEYCIR